MGGGSSKFNTRAYEEFRNVENLHKEEVIELKKVEQEAKDLYEKILKEILDKRNDLVKILADELGLGDGKCIISLKKGYIDDHKGIIHIIDSVERSKILKFNTDLNLFMNSERKKYGIEFISLNDRFIKVINKISPFFLAVEKVFKLGLFIHGIKTFTNPPYHYGGIIYKCHYICSDYKNAFKKYDITYLNSSSIVELYFLFERILFIN